MTLSLDPLETCFPCSSKLAQETVTFVSAQLPLFKTEPIDTMPDGRSVKAERDRGICLVWARRLSPARATTRNLAFLWLSLFLWTGSNSHIAFSIFSVSMQDADHEEPYHDHSVI